MQITHMQKELVKFWKKMNDMNESEWVYHELYVQSDTLFSVDLFQNFRDMCLEIYELNSAKFLWAPALAWKAAFKKTKAKLDLLTDIDILLMVEKVIIGGVSRSINRYRKPNNKYMKDYEKSKESSYIQYWDVNNLYGWAMLQKLPVNNFAWIKDTSQFNKDFMKNIMKKVVKDIFLKLMFSFLKNYIDVIMIYSFYLKEWELKRSKKL